MPDPGPGDVPCCAPLNSKDNTATHIASGSSFEPERTARCKRRQCVPATLTACSRQWHPPEQKPTEISSSDSTDFDPFCDSEVCLVFIPVPLCVLVVISSLLIRRIRMIRGYFFRQSAVQDCCAPSGLLGLINDLTRGGAALCPGLYCGWPFRPAGPRSGLQIIRRQGRKRSPQVN